jgi:hypothetical protein
MSLPLLLRLPRGSLDYAKNASSLALLTGSMSLDALIGPGFEALCLLALLGMELVGRETMALSGDLISIFSCLLVALLFSGKVGLSGSSLVLSTDF